MKALLAMTMTDLFKLSYQTDFVLFIRMWPLWLLLTIIAIYCYHY